MCSCIYSCMYSSDPKPFTVYSFLYGCAYLDISGKWDHAICGLSLSIVWSYEVHMPRSMGQYLVPFKGWITFHCVHRILDYSSSISRHSDDSYLWGFWTFLIPFGLIFLGNSLQNPVVYISFTLLIGKQEKVEWMEPGRVTGELVGDADNRVWSLENSAGTT